MKRLELKKDFFHGTLGNYVHQQYLVRRISPNEKATAITLIPKNASTTFRSHRIIANWRVSHWLHTKQSDFQEIAVLFRDPYQRWISGVTEYCHRVNEDPTTIDLDQIVFDEHTVAQSNYLYMLNPKKCIFFMLEDDGVNKINLAYNVLRDNKRDNITAKEISKAKVRDIILDIVGKDQEGKVKDYYKKDYMIMDKYYG